MAVTGEVAVLETAETRAAKRSWLGLCLVVAVVLQGTGAFLRYATVTPAPIRAAPSAPSVIPAFGPVSYSFYDGLGLSGRPGFFLIRAVAAVLGILFLAKASRGRAAVIIGFCMPAFVGASYAVLTWARASRRMHLGPGFFMMFAGFSFEAIVVVALVLRVWTTRTARMVAGVLSGACAVVVGASTLVFPVKFVKFPLAPFSPLSVGSAAIAGIGVVALAAVPLLASRVDARTAVALLAAMAAYLAIEVQDSVVRRFNNNLILSHELTIGFWLDLLGLALLLGLVIRRRTSNTTPTDSAQPTP